MPLLFESHAVSCGSQYNTTCVVLRAIFRVHFFFFLKLDRRPTDRQVICRDGNDGMDYPLYFLTSDVMLHLHHLLAIARPMADGLWRPGRSRVADNQSLVFSFDEFQNENLASPSFSYSYSC